MSKTTKNLRQESARLGQDSNRAPLERKSEALPFEGTYSYDDVLFDGLAYHFGGNCYIHLHRRQVCYESENDAEYEKGGQFFRPYILNNFWSQGLPFYSADEGGAFIRDLGTYRQTHSKG